MKNENCIEKVRKINQGLKSNIRAARKVNRDFEDILRNKHVEVFELELEIRRLKAENSRLIDENLDFYTDSFNQENLINTLRNINEGIAKAMTELLKEKASLEKKLIELEMREKQRTEVLNVVRNQPPNLQSEAERSRIYYPSLAG